MYGVNEEYMRKLLKDPPTAEFCPISECEARPANDSIVAHIMTHAEGVPEGDPFPFTASEGWAKKLVGRSIRYRDPQDTTSDEDDVTSQDASDVEGQGDYGVMLPQYADDKGCTDDEDDKTHLWDEHGSEETTTFRAIDPQAVNQANNFLREHLSMDSDGPYEQRIAEVNKPVGAVL